MSDYTQVIDYSAKDALTAGDPNKLVAGADVDSDLSAIATAIASKYDSADLSSLAQAQAGTDNTTIMTPLRTEQWKTTWIAEAITFSGLVKFSSTALEIEAAAPIFVLDDTDAGADERAWPMLAAAGVFTLGAGTDAAPTVADTSPMRVLRTGTVIDEVEFNATLVDVNSTLDVSGVATFTASNPSIVLQAAIAMARFEDTGAAADNGKWRLYASSETFVLETIDDALSGTAPVMVVNRTGTTVDSIQLNGTTLDLNGSIDLSGDLTVSGTFSILGTAETLATFIDDGAVTLYHNNNARIQTTSTGIDIMSSTTVDLGAALLTTDNLDASEAGYKGMPPVNHSAASSYPIVLADAGKHVFLSVSATGATIPANGSEAFPLGTVISIVNTTGGNVTISITTDTLTWGGVGTAGPRTLTDDGVATIIKTATAEWIITGAGLS